MILAHTLAFAQEAEVLTARAASKLVPGSSQAELESPTLDSAQPFIGIFPTGAIAGHQ